MLDNWVCHICGEKRPDSQISVHKRDISLEWGLPVGTIQETVRYCNDRHKCVDGSKTLTTATGRELAKKLFCGSPVATTSSIGVWYCVRCNFETVDPEGTCAGCGGNLEITGRPGEAPSPFMPLPADISLPLLGITGGNTDDAETVPQYIPIWHRLWRNWPVHNIIAHPLHEILYWFGLNRFGEALHDGTVPADSGGR